MAPRIACVHDQLFVGLSCREPEHMQEFAQLGISHWADHRRTRCEDVVLSLVPGIVYLWNPTKDDGSAKPLRWYSETLTFARGAIAKPDSRLVVTCARGQHRGPSMAYLILRSLYGLSQVDSEAALLQAWPTGDPWYKADIEAKLNEI